MFFKMIWQLIQAWFLGRAAKGEIPDDECVACGGRDLDFEAEAAYRCLACGYEGGSGWNVLRERSEDDAIAALSSEERRALAIRKLREAKTLVLGAEGTLSSASTSNTLDLVGVGSGAYGGFGGDGSAAQQELVSGMGDLLHAERAMQVASRCVGRKLPQRVRLTVELGFAGASLDSVGDLMIGDLYTTSKVVSARRHAGVMTDWIEQAIAKLERGDV